MPTPRSADLLPHAATPCAVLDALRVEVAPAADGRLRLSYRLSGRLAALRLPAKAAPERADGLWRHTCCEAFVGVPGDPAYREFNFSPSGRWAAYAFAGPRRRVADPALDPPAIDVVAGAQQLRLVATLPASALPAAPRLELGLSAVIEATDGARSYWALCHAAPAPDFHRRESFTFRLDFPDRPA